MMSDGTHTAGPHGTPGGQRPDPAALREGLAAYVAALHEGYLDTVRRQAPEQEATLPLADGEFAVAFVAAGGLHLLATREPLPARAAHEQPLWGELGPLRWEVRFLDASVVPGLAGLSAEPDREQLLAVLGIRGALYHLMLGGGSALSGHHARHAGTGLAGAHLAARG